MSNLRIAFIVAFIISPLYLSAAKDAPDDLSVAAYEAFMANIDEKIDQNLTDEFKEQQEYIDLISVPFKIGEEVTIIVKQGGRTRKFVGVFRRLLGNRVQIGDYRINLKDIIPQDRERLAFSDNEAVLQEKITQLKAELEEEKTRRRVIQHEKLKRAAGYTHEFFRRCEIISGRYWAKPELGDGKVELVLLESEADEHVILEIVNETEQKLDVIFIYKMPPDGEAPDKKPQWKSRFTSIGMDGESPVLSGKRWSRSKKFRLRKSDLGDSVIDSIADNHELWVAVADVGTWRLKPGSKPISSKSVSRDKISCPECLGDQTVANHRYVEDGDQPETIDCPTCGGDGRIAAETYRVKRSVFSYSLVPKKIRNWQKDSVKSRLKAILAAYAHQDDVRSDLGKDRAAVRDRRLTAEYDRQALIDKIKNHRLSLVNAATSLTDVDDSYEWLHPDDEAVSKYRREMQTMDSFHAQHVAPDPVYPTVIVFSKEDGDGRKSQEKVDIQKCTGWKRGEKANVNTKYYELFNLEYRILKKGRPESLIPGKTDDGDDEQPGIRNDRQPGMFDVPGMRDPRDNRPPRNDQHLDRFGIYGGEEEQEEQEEQEEVPLEEMTVEQLEAVDLDVEAAVQPSYFIEYQLSLQNRDFTLKKMPISIVVEFNDDTKVHLRDNFRIQRRWFGRLMGVHQIKIEKLQTGIRSVRILPPDESKIKEPVGRPTEDKPEKKKSPFGPKKKKSPFGSKKKKSPFG
ncbi:MAG: hypothetical protein QGF67_03130 [Lentisphaeria bacterium]|jgi:hypothetical protein|nr:hypothetical protein [Lentisphaeria bacterium]